MIPDNVDYKTFKRFGSFAIGTTKTGSTSTAALVYPSIENGNVFVNTDDLTEKYSKTVDYTYGSWTAFKILAWVNSSNKLSVAVYSDDTLVYYGISTKTVAGLAAADLNFGYYNDLEGTKRVEDKTTANWSKGIHTDATTGKVDTIVSTTCYDDITIQLLPESAKVSEEYVNDLANAEMAAIPYLEIIDLPADALADTSESGYKDNLTDNAETGIRTITALKAGDIISATGIASSRLLQGSSTKAESKYQIVTEGDRKYLSAKSTNYQVMTNAMRKSFAEYLRSDDTHTLVGKYDIYIPAESASIKRTHSFVFTLDAATSGTYKRIVNDFGFSSNIKDGKITFISSTDHQGKDIDGAERSESRNIPSNTWKTITYVIEITHGEDSYAVDTYGIYENEVIYVNSHVIEYEDFNENGITDELGFNANTFTVDPGASVAEYETCIDNISLVKNNNFDWTGIDKDAWVNRRVELVLDAEGNIDVLAVKKNVIFTTAVLVVALYDENGKVVELLKSTETTDGKFIYEVPAAKVATAKKIKAFVFDAITTAVPQMPHGIYVVE